MTTPAAPTSSGQEIWRSGEVSVRMIPGHVAIVTVHRPPHNYVVRSMLLGLVEAFDMLDGNADCRAILLCTEGKSFCAGAMHDPDEPETMVPEMEGDQARYDLIARLFSNAKPIVAAVQGSAVGAGLGLVMLADFRVASTGARFAANFIKIGFCPGFGLTFTLPRLIGIQRAATMFLTARRFTAEEVLPWGLVDQVVAPEETYPAATELALEIASGAPLAIVATRARVREGLAEGVRASLEIDSPEQTRLRLTEDHVEGVVAYRDRRPATFVGR